MTRMSAADRDAMIPPEPEAEPAAAPDSVRALLARAGPSYIVDVPELAARLVFRDVRVDRELSADVTILVGGRHIFRSTSSLSLTGRDRLAKTAAELSYQRQPAPLWRRAVYTAAEAVLQAEEGIGGGVDLRAVPITSLDTTWIADPIQPAGPSAIVGPGESGKSTIARAIALSVATGKAIIPTIVPRVTGPVLIVAGEDSGYTWHARSLEALARGAGIDRTTVDRPITLLDARGRKLNRIARSIAERAADHALVVLDSLSALLPSLEHGGVRDRDAAFYDAVDAISRPTLIVAHPNLDGARRWDQADGRIAGSEVNRDRLRMSWRLAWRDERPIAGSSFRRYTLTNTKWNHGPRPAPVGFAAGWTFGLGGDAGTLTFTATEPFEGSATDRGPTDVERATIDAWKDGNRTPTALGRVLGIEPNAAKTRITRLKSKGLLSDEVA